MSGLLELRSRWQEREWPRSREGALKDERAWVRGLDDASLRKLAADLGRIDKAVKMFRDKKDAA